MWAASSSVLGRWASEGGVSIARGRGGVNLPAILARMAWRYA
jgi:hypothetical protein